MLHRGTEVLNQHNLSTVPRAFFRLYHFLSALSEGGGKAFRIKGPALNSEVYLTGFSLSAGLKFESNEGIFEGVSERIAIAISRFVLESSQ